MQRFLVELEPHLTSTDLEKIKTLYGYRVGLGCLEKCENDTLQILRLLYEKNFLCTNGDLQILLDSINKPNLLKGNFCIFYKIIIFFDLVFPFV